MGAQSWFPSNNYPTDKATFDTLITVPSSKTALGVGELVSRTEHRNGTTTWHWQEDDPTATYLTTATVGDFIYREESMVETSTGRTLPIYNAIDSTATPAQLTAINTSLAAAPAQLNFLSDLFGPYPFDSTGAVADRAAGVGYALEVQTKPHYSGSFTSGNPSININTQLHEIAHQWVGNSVTLETWADIWFNEGWANWATWYWQFAVGTGADPAVIFDELYAETPEEDWAIAPAILDGDPANMFASFPTYDRGAMTIQGYREIVGDDVFFEFVQAIQAQFAYGNISTAEFIDVALDSSGFQGADLALLNDYFQQWLYGETKPTILPESFAESPRTVGGMEAHEVTLLLTDVEASTRLLVRHGQSGVVALGPCRRGRVGGGQRARRPGVESARRGRQRSRAVHVGRRGGCRGARRERAVGCRALAGRRSGRRPQRGPRR